MEKDRETICKPATKIPDTIKKNRCLLQFAKKKNQKEKLKIISRQTRRHSTKTKELFLETKKILVKTITN